MTYLILGPSLHATADRAREYFKSQYGATHFQCEQQVGPNLPMKPTWQADLRSGYKLCVEVRESPFSASLYEFIASCTQAGTPVKLWVAVPSSVTQATFKAELRQASNVGVGVVEIPDSGVPHEFHKPVSLSLFALKKTNLALIPKSRREVIKTAEDAFLDGTPDQGCQAICQELEDVTRTFARYTHDNGLWTMGAGATTHSPDFFGNKPWAHVLDALDRRIDVQSVRAKCGCFEKTKISGAQYYTGWRNSVSHKPRSLKALQSRDAKLRTMFEGTRDLLVDWYDISKPFKLVK